MTAAAPLDGLDAVSTLLLWLAVQPVGVGVAVVIGAGVLLSVIGITAVNAVASPTTVSDNNLVGGAKFAFLAQVYAALLAFVLVDGGIRYTVARGNLQAEASALRLLDETASDLRAPAGANVHAAIRAYADTVLRSEFMTMQAGRESATAKAALDNLVAVYLATVPADDHEALSKLQSDSFLARAVAARNTRINAIRPGLKSLIWTFVAVNTVLAIGFSWFFGSPSYVVQLTMGVLLSVALMTVVYMALLLHHPFTGDLGISGRAFELLLSRGSDSRAVSDHVA